MSAVHTHPVDYIAAAYQRIRCIQELLTQVQPGKNLDLGPDATCGLYLLLEDALETLTQALTLLEPA